MGSLQSQANQLMTQRISSRLLMKTSKGTIQFIGQSHWTVLTN
jgi:hypothetical protein